MYRELNEALLTFNRLQSENYEGESHDLQPAQERIRQLLSGMELRRGLVRLAVECEREVRCLRNKLDDYGNYGTNGTKRAELARKMRPDVLELMERRDSAARKLRYDGYADAILSADGITEERLRERLEAYLDGNLEKVSSGARTAKLHMDDWFVWLSRGNALEETCEPMPLLKGFAKKLGLTEVLPRLDIRVADSFCYASQTDGERILMQISPIREVDGWNTLFHEFGHACVYANLPENRLPLLSPLVDEAVAVLFENAAVRLLAKGTLREKAMELLHTEYTRTCISGLFELDLWKDRDGPERLYERWYSRLGVRVEPEKWAIDSFRSIDCMTIFAYTLGQSLADGLSDDGLLEVFPKIVKNAADMTLQDLIRECGQWN